MAFGPRLSVVTWLWHDPAGRWNKFHRYTPGHVNRLHAMVRANLSVPHDFVVVTDQPDAAFSPGIRAVPLWDDLRDMGGCWCRLKAFDRKTGLTLGKRLLSMDLDCVVTGDLTPLVTRKDRFVICAGSIGHNPYNGSMWLMTPGARQGVWDRFDRATSPQEVRDAGLIGTDQAWIAHALGDGEPTWGKAEGVLMYRRDCRGGLPLGTRVVFFPGKLKPNSTIARAVSPWIASTQDAAMPLLEKPYLDRRDLRQLSGPQRRLLKEGLRRVAVEEHRAKVQRRKAEEAAFRA